MKPRFKILWEDFSIKKNEEFSKKHSSKCFCFFFLVQWYYTQVVIVIVIWEWHKEKEIWEMEKIWCLHCLNSKMVQMIFSKKFFDFPENFWNSFLTFQENQQFQTYFSVSFLFSNFTLLFLVFVDSTWGKKHCGRL